jgi:hypothetical protein
MTPGIINRGLSNPQWNRNSQNASLWSVVDIKRYNVAPSQLLSLVQVIVFGIRLNPEGIPQCCQFALEHFTEIKLVMNTEKLKRL